MRLRGCQWLKAVEPTLVRFRPTVVVSVFRPTHISSDDLGGAPAASVGRMHYRFDHSQRSGSVARAICFLSPTNKQPRTAGAGCLTKGPRDRIPVTPKFAELGERRQPVLRERGILYMINADPGRAGGNIRGLMPDVRLTVTLGATNGCGNCRRSAEAGPSLKSSVGATNCRG